MRDELPAALQTLCEWSPARVFIGRAGAAYRTETQLTLRQDHAAARDAVQAELQLHRDLADAVEPFRLFEVQTLATSKADYLKNPQKGRQFSEPAREEIRARCPAGADLQVVVGDGLSALAVSAQAPPLLKHLADGAAARNWTLGQTFVIRYCRVGVLNAIGELLSPGVVVLLIGERPGLATAESLSAYLAWSPQPGQTDADRNLISNIHARGVPVSTAAERILNLAQQMRTLRRSGTCIKECLLPTRIAPSETA